MRTAAQLYSRYRLLGLAVLLSAVVHAAVMIGMPPRIESIEEGQAAVYEASLDPTAILVRAPAPQARPAPRRAARPRAPIALPPDALAALPVETANDLAPELAAAPDIVALAQPAVPVKELAPPPFPVDAVPSDVSIEYHLTSAVADGRAAYHWEREGDTYRIRGEAEAEGFFTLFLEGRVVQESHGTVTSRGLKPEHFTEQRPNAGQEGVLFDWAARTVTFERERKEDTKTAPLQDNTVDWLSMIFQLAHVPPSGDALQMQVFTQRRMYAFKLQVLGVEEIEIPLGRVRALHLRHRDPEKNETVDVWLGMDQYNLPVKMRYPVARNRVTVEQVATSVRSNRP